MSALMKAISTDKNRKAEFRNLLHEFREKRRGGGRTRMGSASKVEFTQTKKVTRGTASFFWCSTSDFNEIYKCSPEDAGYTQVYEDHGRGREWGVRIYEFDPRMIKETHEDEEAVRKTDELASTDADGHEMRAGNVSEVFNNLGSEMVEQPATSSGGLTFDQLERRHVALPSSSQTSESQQVSPNASQTSEDEPFIFDDMDNIMNRIGQRRRQLDGPGKAPPTKKAKSSAPPPPPSPSSAAGAFQPRPALVPAAARNDEQPAVGFKGPAPAMPASRPPLSTAPRPATPSTASPQPAQSSALMEVKVKQEDIESCASRGIHVAPDRGEYWGIMGWGWGTPNQSLRS